MTNIKRRSRFIKQQHWGFLRQSACYHNSLALSARKRANHTRCELSQVKSCQHFVDHLFVVRRLRSEMFYVWVATQQHIFVNRHIVRHQRRLRHERNVLRAPLCRCRGYFLLVDRDRTRIFDQAGGCSQYRRFAGAIRADQAEPLARMQNVVEAIDGTNTVVFDRQITKTECAHA